MMSLTTTMSSTHSYDIMNPHSSPPVWPQVGPIVCACMVVCISVSTMFCGKCVLSVVICWVALVRPRIRQLLSWHCCTQTSHALEGRISYSDDICKITHVTVTSLCHHCHLRVNATTALSLVWYIKCKHGHHRSKFPDNASWLWPQYGVGTYGTASWYTTLYEGNKGEW